MNYAMPNDDGFVVHQKLEAPSQWDEPAVLDVMDTRPPLRLVSEDATPRVARRLPIVTRDDLDRLAPPQALVAGLLDEDTLAAIVGPPGSFKTATALGLALAVGMGLPWLGRAVHPGPVLYVLAEGTRGLRPRVEAWERVHQLRAGCHFLLRPIPFLAPDEIGTLAAQLEGWVVPPKLIVVDTLARCFLDGEENSATDMGRLVAQADRLRRATGACVLFLHHVDQAKGKIRGSTALAGALDTIITLKKDHGLVRVGCDKQKDAEEFPPFYMQPRMVDLGNGRSAIVMEAAPPTAGAGAPKTIAGPSPIEDALLQHLSAFGDGGASVKDWKRRVVAAGVTSARSFARHKKALVERGQVSERQQGRSTMCRPATPAGDVGDATSGDAPIEAAA